MNLRSLRSLLGRSSRAKFLRQAGPFYHVTTEANWKTIETEGLRPDRWNRDRYRYVAGAKGPFVCFAASWHRDKYVHMVRSDRRGQVVVLLAVAADMVARLRVELDHTTDEKKFYESKEGTTEFSALVRAGVPLICYDVVPPDALTLVERYEAL